MRPLETLLGTAPPWIIGVLNITPDSFSDGGRFISLATALAHAECLLEEGAHGIDIGGEATGPGTRPISAEDELARIEKAVRALAPRCIVSVDTYKAETARRCLELGAQIINDTSALRADPELVRVIAKQKAFVVLMFAKGSHPMPHANNEPRQFDDVVSETSEFLLERAEYAISQGIPAEHVILDPGMGRFLSNEAEDSWELLRRFDELCKRVSPFPVMIGTSRKGFLGGALDERDPISQLTALHAVRQGAALVRTHRPRMAREFVEAGERLRRR